MTGRLTAILGVALVLAACSGGDDTMGNTSGAEPEQLPNSRPIVTASDDINVDIISVQYGSRSKYVGELSFNIGTMEPRLPDPATEVFIVVVREPPAAAQMANFNRELKSGYVYQWLGGTEFHEIMPVDLALSDDEISKLFGVGRPSNGQLLVEALEGREINMARVTELLNAVDNVNYRNSAGRAAIHRAAYWGHSEVVKMLVERGADVNLPGMNGGSALSSAAAGGNVEIVEFLLGAGADVESHNDYGDSPLHAAMYSNGCIPCARLLIANGASLDHRNADGMTPVSLARVNSGYSMKNAEEMLALLEAAAGGSDPARKD